MTAVSHPLDPLIFSGPHDCNFDEREESIALRHQRCLSKSLKEPQTADFDRVYVIKRRRRIALMSRKILRRTESFKKRDLKDALVRPSHILPAGAGRLEENSTIFQPKPSFLVFEGLKYIFFSFFFLITSEFKTV